MSRFWPGFFQLWLRGQWRGLLTASAFALLLNLALTTTFIWPELLNKHIVLAIWVALCGVWVVSVLRVRPEISSFLANNSPRESMPGLFIRAQAEYLRGNWFEAESLLQHLADPGGDVDAKLMLATLYRRIGRDNEATQQLHDLARMPRANAWSFEIQRELELVEQAARASSNSVDNFPGSQKSGMPEAA